jgi:hypothetical protein
MRPVRRDPAGSQRERQHRHHAHIGCKSPHRQMIASLPQIVRIASTQRAVNSIQCR